MSECSRHSRVALKTFERLFLDFVSSALSKYASENGLTLSELLELFESGKMVVEPERLLEVAKRNRMVALVLGSVVGWAKKRGGISYEEALKLAEECSLEATAKFLKAYPRISQTLIDLVNKLASGG